MKYDFFHSRLWSWPTSRKFLPHSFCLIFAKLKWVTDLLPSLESTLNRFAHRNAIQPPTKCRVCITFCVCEVQIMCVTLYVPPSIYPSIIFIYFVKDACHHICPNNNACGISTLITVGEAARVLWETCYRENLSLYSLIYFQNDSASSHQQWCTGSRKSDTLYEHLCTALSYRMVLDRRKVY